MTQKESLTRLFRQDPHNPFYRIGLALLMEEDDIVMLPLNRLEISRIDENGNKQEKEELAYAYTRFDLLEPDFVPACCRVGLVGEFAGETVTGCYFAWLARLVEITSQGAS